MKAFLNEIYQVDEKILDSYISLWSEYSVPKKTIMTAPGDTERYWYYVVDGIQKSYYLHQDKQHIIAFTYPPSFTGIPESFFTQSKSKYYLETITESNFLRISFEQHEEFMKENRAIETLFRKLTEHLLVGVLERYFELMALDMESRFTSFMKRSPHLLQLISQKDLASYLRIDSTNFSKLINQVRI